MLIIYIVGCVHQLLSLGTSAFQKLAGTFALCFWTSKIYDREELALASHQCNLYVMARTAKASLESNAIAHPSFFCLFDVRTTHHCIDMKTVLLTTWL